MNRTLMKTGTYALMHFTVAIAVAYLLTRNWHVALAVGIVEPLVQTVAFALHERAWSRGQQTQAIGICGHIPVGLSQRTSRSARGNPPATGGRYAASTSPVP